MSDDWKTLRVPTEAWERAKEQKETNGRTWGEQIVRQDDDNEGRVLSENAIAELVEEFGHAVEPEQGMVDDSKMAREVAAHIDYAELAKRTADELEGRMR